MLENKKNVFWEALLITLVVFILGFLIGIWFENSQAATLEEYYTDSDIALSDGLASTNLFDLNVLDCNTLEENNLFLADKIYQESILLEDYEGRGKITDGIKLVHKKYDLLRTFLWMNNFKILERCDSDYNLIVYLYKYETADAIEKATQNVWSKVLLELKEKEGADLVLIPIAVDGDISSLNAIVSSYNISEYPVIIINNKDIVSDISSVDELEEFLH